MLRQYGVSVLLVLCISISAVRAQASYAAQDCYQRGNARYKKGDLDGAIAEYTRAIELSSQLVHKKDPKDSRLDFDRVRVLDPMAAQAYASRCMMRYVKREYDEAIDDCTRAIAINPRLADAYHYRGISYFEKKDWEVALEDFDRSRIIDPHIPEASSSSDSGPGSKRGNPHPDMSTYEKARADFNQAIKLNPRLVEAYYSRGFARRALLDQAGALQDFEFVIKINPHQASGYLGRGMVRCDREELEEAIRDFSRAIELDPKFAGAYANRGLALMRLSKDDQARPDLDHAIALNPLLKDVLFECVKHVKQWGRRNR